ncbi:MAG: hypothetical protein NVSMB17_15540 [Candidatus Dormibacteria bacterium]
MAPDWTDAPARLGPLAAASTFDRSLGVAVHGALARWQRGVDGGASRRPAALLESVRASARAARLEPDRLERGLGRLEPGLRWYAEGPWPRRATLFLEQPVTHVLAAADGFAVQLHLRVDRVARFQRGVAIVDFKTVTPHALQARVDRWQLLTYALATPDLLGVMPPRVALFIIDLQRCAEVAVESSEAARTSAATDLLTAARKIAGGDFGVAGHPDRPCWSCGFRLTCPESLSREAPLPRPAHR